MSQWFILVEVSLSIINVWYETFDRHGTAIRSLSWKSLRLTAGEGLFHKTPATDPVQGYERYQFVTSSYSWRKMLSWDSLKTDRQTAARRNDWFTCILSRELIALSVTQGYWMWRAADDVCRSGGTSPAHSPGVSERVTCKPPVGLLSFQNLRKPACWYKTYSLELSDRNSAGMTLNERTRVS